MSNVTEMHRVIDLPTSLHISVCVTAVLVNSFVLVVIWKDPKKCLRTRSAMLITSLIISDLFAAVVNITRTVHEIWLERRLQSRPIAFVLIIGSYDALMISFVTIFLISVEHLLAITHPIKLKILVTKKRISVIIISTWLGCTTILVGVYHLPGYNNELFQTITACSVLLFIALPTIYARAFFSLRQQSKAIKVVQDGCSYKSGKQKRITQQRNFLLTSAVLILTYLLTCAPFIFRHYLKTSQNANYNMRRDNDSTGAFLWIILYVNLFLDPFLYCLRIPQYRKSCIAFICKGREQN